MSWGLVDNDGVGGCCGVMDTRQQSGTAGGNQTTSSAQRSEYLRNKALAAAINDGESVAGAARRYGVSRRWAYKIKRRWDADGDSGLLPRSRAARTIANRTDAVPASRIVELRKQLEKDGPDAGAESIAARLEREGVRPPANSTIHRILVSAGLVRPEPGKRPKASYTRFEASPPDEPRQSDFTHWPIATVPGAVAVSRLDDRSRNPLHARAFATVTMDDVEAAFLQACAEHGIPAKTLTDNGTVYTTRPISATPGRFERTLALMGVRQSNGRPCHPPDAGQDRTLPPHPEAMALRPSPGVLDRRAQRTARRIPARLQRGAAAPRARPTNPGEACRAEGKALPDPELAAGTQTKLDEQRRRETTACSPGATRRKPIPKDERAEPARADVTIGPKNPQDRQARLRHAEQHRRQTPDLQPRQAQRRTHGRTAHRPRPGRRHRPGDRRDPRRPDARRHPRIPIPQTGERCQRCPTTDVKHASGDPSTMPQDITVLPLISLVT